MSHSFLALAAAVLHDLVTLHFDFRRNKFEFFPDFNADLVLGLEMSGGWGLFQPQGRLPAHLHDFDESISIVGGSATCRVEGREYAVADGGTALVPRGRVHYFINESQGTMEMLWVYAGPMPERSRIAGEATAPAERVIRRPRTSSR